MPVPSVISAPSAAQDVSTPSSLKAAGSIHTVAAQILSTTRPHSTTLSSTAMPTHSPQPSAIDPPTIAAIVVGGIAASVLTFCLVGSLVHWLYQRRKRKLREAVEPDSRWNSTPYLGAEISAPLPRNTEPDLVFKAYPKMSSPGAGLRFDPGKIGMAVSGDPPDRSGTPVDSKSHMPHSAYHQKRPAPFEEDDPTMGLPPQETYDTLDPRSTGPGLQAQSALRPRQAPPHPKRTPPPLAIPSKNYLGAPLIRFSAGPVRERQNPIRVASNAHAQNQSLISPPVPLTMKPLPPIQARLPSYIPEYYTSSTPFAASSISRDTDITSPIEQFRDSEFTMTPSVYSALPSSMLQPTPREAHSGSRDPSPNFTAKYSIPPIAELSGSPRSSASSATTFESLDSCDITPPEQPPQVGVSQSHVLSPTSPLFNLQYPKVPRSTAQQVARSGFTTSQTSTPSQSSTEWQTPKACKTKAPLSAPLQSRRGIQITLSTSSASSATTTATVSSTPTTMATSTSTSTARSPHLSSAMAGPGPRPRPRRLNTAGPSFSTANAISMPPAGAIPATSPCAPPTSWRSLKSSMAMAATISPPLPSARSVLSGAPSPRGMRSAVAWTAGCGAIEVALRSPILAV